MNRVELELEALELLPQEEASAARFGLTCEIQGSIKTLIDGGIGTGC